MAKRYEARSVVSVDCALSGLPAFMVHYYINGPGKEEYAESLAVVSAELVAARFVWKARKIGCSLDEADLDRRFPARRSKPRVAQLARTTRRVEHIVGLIDQAEIKQDPASLGSDESGSITARRERWSSTRSSVSLCCTRMRPRNSFP